MRGVLPWRGFLLDCLLGAVLLIGSSTLLIVPIVIVQMAKSQAAGNFTNGAPDITVAMPLVTLAAILAMLATAGVMWWLRGRRLPGTLRRMTPWRAYGLAAVAGIAIQFSAQGFAALMATAGGALEPSNAEPIVELIKVAPWIAWLSIVIVGPFAEELLMRHVLLRRFALAGFSSVGVLLTSVAFAMLHEPVPTGAGVVAWLGGLAMYSGMGAGFAWVYLHTGRFRAAFLSHATCNAAALAVAAYAGS